MKAAQFNAHGLEMFFTQGIMPIRLVVCINAINWMGGGLAINFLVEPQVEYISKQPYQMTIRQAIKGGVLGLGASTKKFAFPFKIRHLPNLQRNWNQARLR
jgi:hypothetical protein